MKNALTTINIIAMKALTWATTTMSAFWFLFILIVAANALNPPKDIQTLLLILVSEFYQGIALPGLGAQQKAEAEETRKLLQETHDIAMNQLASIRETHDGNAQILAEMKEIHEGNQQELAEIKEILSLLKSKAKEE